MLASEIFNHPMRLRRSCLAIQKHFFFHQVSPSLGTREKNDSVLALSVGIWKKLKTHPCKGWHIIQKHSSEVVVLLKKCM